MLWICNNEHIMILYNADCVPPQWCLICQKVIPLAFISFHQNKMEKTEFIEHCSFLLFSRTSVFRSRFLIVKAKRHGPSFALDSYKRQKQQLFSWELHALRHGNITAKWSDRNLQMESEVVAEVHVLFSKWKSTPERRGHVLWSPFLSSPLAPYRVSLHTFMQREDVTDLSY